MDEEERQAMEVAGTLAAIEFAEKTHEVLNAVDMLTELARAYHFPEAIALEAFCDQFAKLYQKYHTLGSI